MLKLVGIVIAVLVTGSAALSSCPGPGPLTCTRTISSGISAAENAAHSGDTICVHGGTYKERVELQTSGVTVVAVSGETPTVDGTGISIGDTDSLFTISGGVQNVTVDGLTITNSSGRGMQILGSHNLVQNMLITKSRNAALIVSNWFTAATNNVVQNNELANNVRANTPCTTSGGWESAINHYSGGGHPFGANLFTGNRIHDNMGEGMTVADGDTISNNTVTDNYSVGIYFDGVQNATVSSNMVSETETVRPACDRMIAIGIAFADEGSPGRSSGNTVKNNTVKNTSTGINFWNSGSSGTGLKNDVINDNTISQSWNCGLCFDAGAHSGTTVHNNHVSVRSGATVVSGVTASGINYAAG